MSKKLYYLFIFLAGWLHSFDAIAAQKAKIIVNEATVYEYPRTDSETVGMLKLDEWVAISNLPTEGFYKTRLQDGTIGWISGNDLTTKKMIYEEAKARGEELSTDGIPPEPEPYKSKSDRWKSFARILAGGGMQSFSLSPLNSLAGINDLTLGYNLGVEFQFAIWKYLHWAVRGEYVFKSAGPISVSASATRRTQFRSFPLTAGLVMSFPDFKWFRLSVGAYGGMGIGTLLQIQDKTATQVGTLSYNSYDFVGILAAQGAIGLSSVVGLFVDASYRFQTSPQTANATFGFPAITMNYGGFLVRGGIEFRFR